MNAEQPFAFIVWKQGEREVILLTRFPDTEWILTYEWPLGGRPFWGLKEGLSYLWGSYTKEDFDNTVPWAAATDAAEYSFCWSDRALTPREVLALSRNEFSWEAT